MLARDRAEPPKRKARRKAKPASAPVAVARPPARVEGMGRAPARPAPKVDTRPTHARGATRDSGVETAVSGTNTGAPSGGRDDKSDRDLHRGDREALRQQIYRAFQKSGSPRRLGDIDVAPDLLSVKIKERKRLSPDATRSVSVKEALRGSLGKKKGGGGPFPLAAGALNVASMVPDVLGTAKDAGKLGFKIGKNAAREAVDIPLNTPGALYHLGDTAIHDPKQAAKDLAQPYVDLAKHPIKSVVEHPLSTALMFAGGEGAIGRTAGKAMRHSPSKRLREIASVERAPAVVPGTNLEQWRKFSPDVFRKGLQVSREKHQVRRASAKGERKPTTMSEHQIRKRVDEHVATSEGIRRHDRTAIVNKTQEVISRPEPGMKKVRVKPSAATTLAVQNVARTRPQLEAYLGRLEEAAKELSGPALRANKTARKEVEKALNEGMSNHIADRYTQEISLPLQKELVKRGLIEEGQAARARLIPYAREHMGAKHDGEKLVARDGHELSNEEILAHMKEAGVPEPGYLTNAPNQRGRKNFFVPTDKPPEISSGARTGNAVARGTADLHPDMLSEGAAKAQGLVTSADRYAEFLQEFGAKGKSGKLRQMETYKQAKAAAEKALIGPDGEPIPGAVPMRPVQINPFAGKAAQLKATLDHVNGDPAMTKSLNKAIDDALQAGEEGGGAWTLVPDAAADQLLKHNRVVGVGVPGKTAGLVGSKFRTAVLATNPKWLFGNPAEGTVRAAVSRSGPQSWLTGRRAVEQLKKENPKKALELEERVLGGGNMSMDKRVKKYSSAEDYAGTRLAPVANILGKFWQTAGPKQAADLWHGYTDLVMNKVNGTIEKQYQTAAFGKALRDSPLMSGHLNKLSKQAMDDAVKGLQNTNAQVALGREVDRMYGRYSKFSPTERHLIAGYTPFIAWSLNATEFLTKVLPHDHPVLTAVLAAENQASAEWREKHGLRFGVKDAPVFLQGAVPGKNGERFPVGKYTPFGVAQSSTGPLGTLAGNLLPQFSSVMKNLDGKDWKGDDLPEGTSPLVAAAESLVQGTTPLVGQVARIKSNPGTTTEKLRKALDPTYPIKPKGKKGSGGGVGAQAPAPKGGVPGVSQAEIDAIIKESAGSGGGAPAVSQAEIDAMLKGP